MTGTQAHKMSYAACSRRVMLDVDTSPHEMSVCDCIGCQACIAWGSGLSYSCKLALIVVSTYQFCHMDNACTMAAGCMCLGHGLCTGLSGKQRCTHATCTGLLAQELQSSFLWTRCQAQLQLQLSKFPFHIFDAAIVEHDRAASRNIKHPNVTSTRHATLRQLHMPLSGLNVECAWLTPSAPSLWLQQAANMKGTAQAYCISNAET